MSNIRKGSPAGGSPKTFGLDRGNGKLMGVCSGIAKYTGVDTTLIRIGFLGAALLGFGTPVLIYLAIGLIAD